MRYREILKKYWGYDDFRGIQREIIESIAAGRDTLGLMPTGGGKSITFQVPTLAVEGLCLVVTPLVALMKDQVANLKSRGIKATAIYTGMKHSAVITALENCIFGDYKFLYISPERLDSELFITKIKKIPVSLITIDEAHCISQWGHDFRPAYRQIIRLRDMFPSVPVLALTATATADVVNDIQQQLGFKEQNCFKMSFERKNLVYVVRHTENKLQELMHILNRVPGCAIVYTQNRKKTKEVADFLVSQGVTAEYYHAGLTSDGKDAREERWRKGVSRVMVSTNAFGMGIDKPDVRLVVHTELPSSIESYFQEAGRGGRDGNRAYAVALVNRSDKGVMARRLSDNYPSQDYIRKVYDSLCYYYSMALGDGLNCTFEFSLVEFCQKYHLQTLQADSALSLLTRMGYIEYIEDMEYSSRVRFIIARDDLYKLRALPAEYETLMMAIMRNYSGLFTDDTFIDERYLSRVTGLSRHRMYEILVSLNQKRIIHYVPSKRCSIVTFVWQRILGEELRFAPEIYEERRKAFETRLNAMLSYADNDRVCRSRQLLNYFGEKDGHDCGMCDVCQSKRPAPQVAQSDEERLLALLSDGELHDPQELETLGFTRAKMAALLRALCDEEKIEVVAGRVRVPLCSLKGTKKSDGA